MSKENRLIVKCPSCSLEMKKVDFLDNDWYCKNCGKYYCYCDKIKEEKRMNIEVKFYCLSCKKKEIKRQLKRSGTSFVITTDDMSCDMCFLRKNVCYECLKRYKFHSAMVRHIKKVHQVLI